MSTDAIAPDEPEELLRTRIERFMLRNFPQIQIHGGDAAVEHIDGERGEIHLRLTGACSGCWISPMTIQALKSRMIAQFEEVREVHAETGLDTAEPAGGDFEDVPF